MRKCLYCQTELSGVKKRNLKFCSQTCNGLFYNSPKTTSGEKPLCEMCEQPLKTGDRFCSAECHNEEKFKVYIEMWLRGALSGLSGNGIVSNHVKRFLRKKYNNQCTLCGWSKVNPHTGKVPLVADHIDGNWRNNKEENLRLLCGCCDSLTATYCGANRGKGRKLNGNIRK